MNRNYLYFLLFIFFSCDFSNRDNDFIPDTSFYNVWNENTKIEIQSCCTSEELKPYIEDKVKRLFRYRARLFDNIIKELPQEKNYLVKEYYSEGNEFFVHRMIVSTSKFGKEASINNKGEIKIDTAKLKSLPLIQANSSESCCPYTTEEIEIYSGYLPFSCITFIEVKKEPTEFKIQLSIN